ncbi:DUF421 domain-containing protein [Microlunatus soli]|uniref:Uncharacterized membrane protein YcaP, DUF421 family n=1 Tax=Microlunatus soli TaxID=630515 RepID=A0A1H1PSA1_9ACTN|nr:YetF domain-containing protein [Microlunatus soli]SDS13994.1 Uncharacterized membrane protein YcaP, DUF421 family [Microlunatus soli]
MHHLGLGRLLGVTPGEALAVVIATIGMYVAMVLAIRLLGQRVLSSLSSFDLAAVIAFGAIIGRSALGEAPRLAGGLLALGTLVVLQAVAGLLRLRPFGERTIAARAVLLMAGSQILDDRLRSCHVSTTELWSRLRTAGIRHPNEVAAAIFEPTGTISVLRRGESIDPRLLTGVVGADRLPPELFGD